MAEQYLKGNKVRLTCAFTVSGMATDPTTVTLKVKDPSGNIGSYTYALAEITRSGAGVFYKDVSLDEEGYWEYRFEGTGSCEAAAEGSIYAHTRF